MVTQINTEIISIEALTLASRLKTLCLLHGNADDTSNVRVQVTLGYTFIKVQAVGD